MHSWHDGDDEEEGPPTGAQRPNKHSPASATTAKKVNAELRPMNEAPGRRRGAAARTRFGRRAVAADSEDEGDSIFP